MEVEGFNSARKTAAVEMASVGNGQRVLRNTPA